MLRALRTPEQVQAYRAGLVDRVRVADLESGAGMIDLLMWDEIGELSPAELDVLQAWSRDKRKVGKKTARQILAVFIVNWVARQAAYSPEQVKTFLTGAREMLAEAPLEDPVLLMETAALYAYVEPVSAESRERCVNAALELMDARDVNALPPLLRACQMQQRGYANSPEYRAQGDWGRARGLFETAAGYFARAGDRAGQAQSLYQVGRSLQPDINLAGGDWTQAAACYAKGAGLLKDAGRPHAQAYFLRQQAYCLQPERNPIGNWDTAAKLYNESGALEALHAHVFEQADCLCMQGYCLSPVRNPAGNWETSARFYEQASKIYAASENKKRLQGVCLHEIAYQRIRADKRNLTPETRELFRRAGALRREAGDEQGAQISESWLR
ncbi:MAG: hypothetical protein M5U26_20515 [Planctomycetota bacterium]|nr:hypothetical protein [Planctomycetota bacterium]